MKKAIYLLILPLAVVSGPRSPKIPGYSREMPLFFAVEQDLCAIPLRPKAVPCGHVRTGPQDPAPRRCGGGMLLDAASAGGRAAPQGKSQGSRGKPVRACRFVSRLHGAANSSSASGGF